MRIRFLVGAKLLEVLSRGVFILFCTYSLPLVDAGKFGLTSTVIGLTSFLIGFERLIDVQRRMAGASQVVIHQQLRGTLHFFGVQYAFVLPILAFLLGLIAQWPPFIVGLFILIAVGEHLANQAYLMTLIDREAHAFLLAVVFKNILLLIAIFLGKWHTPNDFNLFWVMHIWGLASLLFITIVTVLWHRRTRLFQTQNIALPSPQRIPEQYRASKLHFLMGLAAIIALQADRFVVGATLSAEDIGIYFRNITLAGLALQFFSIVSYARISPDIYRLGREGALIQARKTVKTEYHRFALVLICLIGLALGINFVMHNPASRFHIAAPFVAILTVGVLLRTAADYSGLLLLSAGADTRLFHHQITSVIVGLPCMALMAALLGLPGAFSGTLIAPAILLALNMNSTGKP
ncbi:MAG: hypothetical protein JSS58_06090 [Proteobacteria bacterium]|nr:hypothetical protein [Pseudomonadota bacterium]